MVMIEGVVVDEGVDDGGCRLALSLGFGVW
jgi:hypothetical protein